MAGTYVPLLVGALMGAAISLAFIMRTKALSDKNSPERSTPSRQAAVRSVLVVYVLISWICFATAAVVGDEAFAFITGGIAVLATGGAAFQWFRGG